MAKYLLCLTLLLISCGKHPAIIEERQKSIQEQVIPAPGEQIDTIRFE